MPDLTSKETDSAHDSQSVLRLVDTHIFCNFNKHTHTKSPTNFLLSKKNYSGGDAERYLRVARERGCGWREGGRLRVKKEMSFNLPSLRYTCR